MKKIMKIKKIKALIVFDFSLCFIQKKSHTQKIKKIKALIYSIIFIIWISFVFNKIKKKIKSKETTNLRFEAWPKEFKKMKKALIIFIFLSLFHFEYFLIFQ